MPKVARKRGKRTIVCARCQVEKPKRCFHNRASAVNGKQSSCKECMIDAVTVAKWLKRFLAMTPEQARGDYFAYQGRYDDAVHTALLKSMDLRKMISLDGV